MQVKKPYARPRAPRAAGLQTDGLAMARESAPLGSRFAWDVSLPPDEAARAGGGLVSSRWERIGIAAGSSREGFRAARRHSARVRLYRRAAIAGSVSALLIVAGAVLIAPLRRLPGDISVGRVGIEGTKVTLESPKITGVQKDGGPFEIRARSAVQDVTAPSIVELSGIESTIGTAEDSTTWVSAEHGIYDSSLDKLTLKGDIKIKNSGGYDIRLQTAGIDFKTGGLSSKEPVKVVLDGGTIAANELDVSDHGHKVSFGGDVTSIIETDQGEDEGSSSSGVPGR